MPSDTDALRDLYIEVTGEEEVTETQSEEPSHDPIDGEAAVAEEVSTVAREDGLDGAVEGAEVGTAVEG